MGFAIAPRRGGIGGGTLAGPGLFVQRLTQAAHGFAQRVNGVRLIVQRARQIARAQIFCGLIHGLSGLIQRTAGRLPCLCARAG